MDGSANPEGHWPVAAGTDYAGRSNPLTCAESSVLTVENGKSLVRALPPEEGQRKRVWILPIALGLCILPIYQTVSPQPQKGVTQNAPSHAVVEALRLSAPNPAPLLAHPPEPMQPLQTLSTASLMQPAAQFQFLGPVGDRDRAVDCLAMAAWYEAGDNAEEQRSVIQVVLNRVAHPSFPKSVCGVVFQGSNLPTGCQFTFTCDGSLFRRQPGVVALARARAAAELALKGTTFPSLMQATHYHADYVQPWWSGHLVTLGKVGRHVFYRWPGKHGEITGRPRSAGEAEMAQLIRAQADRAMELAAVATPSPDASLAANVAAPSQFAQEPRIVSDAVYLTVDKSRPSGRWAVSALGTCSGLKACRVVGYDNAEQAARNSQLPAGARDKPLFLFIRDAGSGIDLALWDCDKVQRPASNECLPSSGRELTALIRDR